MISFITGYGKHKTIGMKYLFGCQWLEKCVTEKELPKGII